jgi:hypothetical protein
MSDHWNLLADQLGTPNYAPRTKKNAKPENVNDSQEPSKSASSAASDQVSSDVPSATTPEPPRQPSVKETKERSILQSSWDALASLFGVSQNEPEQTHAVQPPVAKNTRGSAPAHPAHEPNPNRDDSDDRLRRDAGPKSTTRKTSKSMWDDPVGSQEEAPKKRSDTREASTPSPSFASSEGSSTEADRRGPRRSPRRGRDESTDENAETVPSRRVQRDKDLGSQGLDAQQPSKSEHRRDRPERGSERRNNRSEESGKSLDERSAPRGDRKPRNQRDQRRDSNPPVSPTHPSPSSPKHSASGFAAGLSPELDHFESDENHFDIQADVEDLQIDFSKPAGTKPRDEEEVEEGASRNRRKKRRGGRRDSEKPQKSESNTSFTEPVGFDDSDGEIRSSESSEERPKHGKIPSWTETIGAVIQANVANHQKQSSGGSRGRNRRPNH